MSQSFPFQSINSLDQSSRSLSRHTFERPIRQPLAPLATKFHSPKTTAYPWNYNATSSDGTGNSEDCSCRRHVCCLVRNNIDSQEQWFSDHSQAPISIMNPMLLCISTNPEQANGMLMAEWSGRSGSTFSHIHSTLRNRSITLIFAASVFGVPRQHHVTYQNVLVDAASLLTPELVHRSAVLIAYFSDLDSEVYNPFV